MSHAFRTTLTAGAVVLASLAAGATPAQADISKTLQYTCKYPLVDKKPLQVDITANIPQFAKINQQQPAFNVNAVATAKDGTSEALVTLDAYKLTGATGVDTSVARASLVFPSGFVQGNLKVPLTIGEWTRTTNQPVPDPLVLTATGTTPSVIFDELGKTDIRLDSLSLQLRAFYEDGAEIKVKKLETDFNGVPITQTDQERIGFEVFCKLNADQSPIIASICVNATGLPDGSCGTAPDTTAPTVPGPGVYEPGDFTPTEHTVRWGASTDEVGGSGLKGYNVEYETDTGTAVEFVPAGTTFKTFTGLGPDDGFYFWISAVDNAGNESVQSEEFLIGPWPDTTAPTVPAAKIDGIKICPSRSVTVGWTPSTDAGTHAAPSGLKGYVLTYMGQTINVPAGTTMYTFTEIAGSDFSVDVAAVDNAGNRSAASTVTANVPIANCVPTKVTGLKAGTITQNSVLLSWNALTDADAGYPAVSYNVYRGSTKVGTVTGTSFNDFGLTADTAYQYAVEAVDSKGLAGAKSDALTVKTLIQNTPLCEQGFACYDYAAKGTTGLKTLTTGSLPLAGGIKAKLEIADGSFTADLTLNNTSGRLTAAGFLPLTAKVGFVPVGKTTGVLEDATATKPQSISTNSKVRIKVLEVKLFGAIPLAGGNSCQTKSLSDINLKSTNAFDPLKGGTIGGTYAISDLNGCGPLNGLVSPLTAGKGNTISLTLTKQ